MDTERGRFFIGQAADGTPILYDSTDLTTHAVIVGMTGSGKTGRGITIIEEALLNGIPCLVIDPKGDMGNLLLNFPDMTPADDRPWIDEAEAERAGITPDELAAKTAACDLLGALLGGRRRSNPLGGAARRRAASQQAQARAEAASQSVEDEQAELVALESWPRSRLHHRRAASQGRPGGRGGDPSGEDRHHGHRLEALVGPHVLTGRLRRCRPEP